MNKRSIGWALGCLLLINSACGSDDDVAITPQQCESESAAALLTCIDEASSAAAACYASTGRICADDEAATQAAVDAATEAVRASCSDDAVQQAGFGPLLTVAALEQRIATSCRSETASLAVRAFGGPQGAAWAAAAAEDRTCLTTAHSVGSELLGAVAQLHDDCLTTGCDPAADSASLVAAAAVDIDGACTDLPGLIAVDADEFAQRAATQAECVTATAHPDAESLGLACGPRDELVRPPRGEYIEIVLDSEEWGTLCGDGSPFAFQLRLAPEGEPLENVLIAMEGGGVCIFEDCADRPAELFEAMNDLPPPTGIMSDDPEENPFANWTKAYLPYCNQDVFIGGGASNTFENGFTVQRYGAINVRAALRYIRDVLWRELDESTAEGYRPDRMRVFFGGFSAGGFGTLYNYHYVLDDLQWTHTTAFPDAALALDSGAAISVRALGAILIPESDLGWSSLPYLPPYCISTDCGVGPVAMEATLPRLKAVPEQQILVLTNQVDAVQVATTFFESTADWINELRFQYCQFDDADGVKHFMPAVPQSRHVISPFPDLYADYPIGGELLVDWMWGAVADPDGVVNRVEEGTLVEAYPGVLPFDCEVEP